MFQTQAHATQPLTVYVGYSGGPYYEKTAYSESELEALADPCYYTYSAIDKKPSLVKYVAWGVPLEKLFSNSIDSVTSTSVNTDALWRLAFDTDDDYKPDDGIYGNNRWYWNYYQNYQYGEVLNTDVTSRFYFSAFDECFDFTATSLIASKQDQLISSGVEVPSMIALKYVKERVETADEWNALDDNLDENDVPEGLGSIGGVDTRNRLLFGQATPEEQEVENEVHSITGVYCIYQGRPTVTLDTDQITGSIGDTIQVRAIIEADDELIEAEGPKDVVWSSENESIATVVSNGDGTASVTIRGKGDVKITATFGDSSSSEFVTETSANVSGPGGSGWRGDGEGEGWNYGDSDGEQGPGTAGSGTGDSGSGTGDSGQDDDDGGDISDGEDEEGDDSDTENESDGGGESPESADGDDESSESADGDDESSESADEAGDSENTDNEDDAYEEGYEPSAVYTFIPEDAQVVVISPSVAVDSLSRKTSARTENTRADNVSSAASAASSLQEAPTKSEGAASTGGSSSDALEQTVEEHSEPEETSQLYRLEQEEEQEAENLQIPWEYVLFIVVLMLASALAQVIYFQRSKDTNTEKDASRRNGKLLVKKAT